MTFCIACGNEVVVRATTKKSPDDPCEPWVFWRCGLCGLFVRHTVEGEMLYRPFTLHDDYRSVPKGCLMVGSNGEDVESL